ncbi:uncharacterized protein VTP21DRAFT_11685 [Calcarisporiella thermophila]|uniref:uncharacterized protein n=1 Tax=Calcarisporiella thermophila TaxID=911321 RepID=UPI00374201EF
MKSCIVLSLITIGLATLASGLPIDKRGVVDGSVNNAKVLSKIGLLNAMVNSNPQDLENNNSNTRAQGKKNNAAGQEIKRGLIDGSLNDAHIIDNISILNALANSSPQTLQNNNANTRAAGKKNNAAGQYEKRHNRHWDGDNIYDDAHVLDHNNIADTNINSDTVYVSNDNANTRARGKGNNSANAKRGLIDGSLNDPHVLDNLNVLNALVNSNPQQLQNNNANTRADGCKNNAGGQYMKRNNNCRRGIIDGSLNDAHVLAGVNVLNALVNSNPQQGEQNNANTRAEGKKNNALGQVIRRSFSDDIYSDAHVLDHNNVANTNINSDTVYVSNSNANTRARGKGNNSADAKVKRGSADNIYDDAHLLDHNDIANTNINSDTVYVSNNNVNSRARGKDNNSASYKVRRVLLRRHDHHSKSKKAHDAHESKSHESKSSSKEDASVAADQI